MKDIKLLKEYEEMNGVISYTKDKYEVGVVHLKGTKIFYEVGLSLILDYLVRNNVFDFSDIENIIETVKEHIKEFK